MPGNTNATLNTVPRWATTTTIPGVGTDPNDFRTFWMQRRKRLLTEVDDIERALAMKVRTAELRQQVRALRREVERLREG